MKLANRIFFYTIIVMSVFAFITLPFEIIKTDYDMVTLYALSAVSIFIAFIPLLFKLIFKKELPEFMVLFILVYTILGILLGSVFNFYQFIPIWDKLLHLFSGTLIVMTLYGLIDAFTKAGMYKSNKWINIVIVLLLTLAVGVVWEFAEFFIDVCFNSNMQRFEDMQGNPFIGQKALMDTMIDQLLAALGAVITLIFYAIFIKENKSKDIYSSHNQFDIDIEKINKDLELNNKNKDIIS
ncbi:MAG: hypothetical protein ACRC5M_07475 [Anaeroplasmataceae bacterium]